MSFRKYEEYKDSGVEWLGDIPAGWTTQKLKFVARVQPSNVDKKSKKDEKDVLLCNYTDVYYNEEITADLPFMKATASDVQIRKFTLESGDTIITKDSEDPNDIAVPAYVPQDLEGVVCGYHLALLRPGKRTCGGYLKRVMDTQYARSVFATRANGITRYGLGTYAINNFILPLPPLEEQKQIAAFLDKETTNIDTLIDKQEQLITLLQEKRQAIISHAVTRGLNPNVKMKDSGIEWLGDVPEHWEVRRLKFCVQLTDQKIEANREKPLPYVGLENIQSWTGKLLPIDPNVVPTSVANRFGKGMTLFGKLRPYLAKACNPDFEGLCSTELLVFKSTGFDRRLLLYLLLTDGFIKVVDSSTYGAKMPRANWDFIGNCIVPVPPLEEQKQIVAFLDGETAKIDTLIEKCETAIELLKERRTALISAAVTGKIDVRNAV